MITVRLGPLPPRAMPAVATSPVLEEVALSARLVAAVSASPMVKGIAAVGVFSLVVWSAMAEMIGRSFTGVTVTVKLRLTVLFALWPSFKASARFKVMLAGSVAFVLIAWLVA